MKPTNEYQQTPGDTGEDHAIATTPYVDNGVLYLPEAFRLPTTICVCCGSPASKQARKAVRNIRKPLTWYSPQPVIEIGLCKSHAEDNAVAIALTFSTLGIGILLFVAGAVTVSVPTLLLGIVAIALSGLFRARKPVWSSAPRNQPMPLHGISSEFLGMIAVSNAEDVRH